MKQLTNLEEFETFCNAVAAASGWPIQTAVPMVRHVLRALEHPLVSLTVEDKLAIATAASQDGAIEAWLDSNPAKHVAASIEEPEVWTIYQDVLNLRATMKRLREQKFPSKG